MLLVLFCAIFAAAVPARAISTPAVFRVAPSDCSDAGGDCYAALAQAVAHCRAHGPNCTVELDPGTFPVRFLERF